MSTQTLAPFAEQRNKQTNKETNKPLLGGAHVDNSCTAQPVCCLFSGYVLLILRLISVIKETSDKTLGWLQVFQYPVANRRSEAQSLNLS